ncbi:hypothetical protein EV128_108162 [Rhizobium azibense]|nr:hypothetical protein EV128_108162 [Rhizobium azibense]
MAMCFVEVGLAALPVARRFDPSFRMLALIDHDGPRALGGECFASDPDIAVAGGKREATQSLVELIRGTGRCPAAMKPECRQPGLAFQRLLLFGACNLGDHERMGESR